MTLSGTLSFTISTLLILELILLRLDNCVAALEEKKQQENNNEEQLKEKTEPLESAHAFSQEELKHFAHLGKLGEQGEILR